MSTFDFPPSLAVSKASLSLKKSVLQSRSPYSGALMAVDLAAERWILSLSLPPVRGPAIGLRRSFFSRLAGGTHRVRAFDFMQPIPAGTMRGTPTLNGAHARGALTLQITTTAGATLKAGDLFSIGGQLFMAADDAQAAGNGQVAVAVVNRMRKATASGTAVVWNKPTADFILPADSVMTAHQPGYADALAIDLEEVW